jgi:hypothetical protein
MPFFLKSCAKNTDVIWRIYTDCGDPGNVPDNVKVIETTYEEYCQKVSSVLHIDFRPKNPYKLCDIKPALGYIHKDDIDGFDFWAFGDIDVVYGDIRKYFTEEKLGKFDIFSTHTRRVSGHLCIVRNSEKMRSCFKKIKNWQSLFSDQKHYALDEGAFSRIFLWRKNFPPSLFRFVGFFNSWRRRGYFSEAYSTPGGARAWIDGGSDFPLRWFWCDGSLTNDRDGCRQFPYFHFLAWKRSWKKLDDCLLVDAGLSSQARAWVIDKDGFHLSAGNNLP